MSTHHEIRSEKILVKDIFSKMWFRIPEYQRPYIWGRDEINDLLDDLTFAQSSKPDQEYFLGSFVFQSRKAQSDSGQDFIENDLLDGQQRMSTLLLLFACIRDLTADSKLKENCDRSIWQEGDDIDHIPERTRIAFAIRQEVQEFVDQFVKAADGTSKVAELEALAEQSKDTSIPNMARAVVEMRRYLGDPDRSINLKEFVSFLRNKVLLIFVATENLDDAFRLFMILNDRGVPLRNSDILKSMNLGALESLPDKTRYAKLWEDAEGELGEDFDRFLNYLRTILVKEKARLNLLQEYEERIYSPKERDKSTGQPKPVLLKRGKETFQLIDRYLKHYNELFGGNNYDRVGGTFQFDNLLRMMLAGLPSTDWVPPLLRYFDRFKYDRLFDFAAKLDNKFSADWIAQDTPTDRIEQMNSIIKVIEAATGPGDVLSNQCFVVDADAFKRNVEAAVYGRRFTRYLLIKLDYFYHDHAHRMAFESLSVEHVLPQTPAGDSQWVKEFTDEQRKLWTDRIGNLVLITTRKNTSLGNSDYEAKKTKYFAKKINTCANSLRVLKNTRWTPAELEANQQEVIRKIYQHYGIPPGTAL